MKQIKANKINTLIYYFSYNFFLAMILLLTLWLSGCSHTKINSKPENQYLQSVEQMPPKRSAELWIDQTNFSVNINPKEIDESLTAISMRINLSPQPNLNIPTIPDVEPFLVSSELVNNGWKTAINSVTNSTKNNEEFFIDLSLINTNPEGFIFSEPTQIASLSPAVVSVLINQNLIISIDHTLTKVLTKSAQEVKLVIIDEKNYE